MERILRKLAVYYMRCEAFFRKHRKHLMLGLIFFLAAVMVVLLWTNSKATQERKVKRIVVIVIRDMEEMIQERSELRE